MFKVTLAKMGSTISTDSETTDEENLICCRHSLVNCDEAFCKTGRRLEINNPSDQKVISEYLDATRKPNNLEEYYARRRDRMKLKKIRREIFRKKLAAAEDIVVLTDEEVDVEGSSSNPVNSAGNMAHNSSSGNLNDDSSSAEESSLVRERLGSTTVFGYPGELNHWAGQDGLAIVSTTDGGLTEAGSPIILTSVATSRNPKNSQDSLSRSGLENHITASFESRQGHDEYEPTPRITNSIQVLSLPNHSAKSLNDLFSSPSVGRPALMPNGGRVVRITPWFPRLCPVTEFQGHGSIPKDRQASNNVCVPYKSRPTPLDPPVLNMPPIGPNKALAKPTEFRPAECYNGHLKRNLCSKKCSEINCISYLCNSKTCGRYSAGSSDVNAESGQLIVRRPARNFQPWQRVNSAVPSRQVSLDRYPTLPVPNGTSHMISMRKPTHVQTFYLANSPPCADVAVNNPAICPSKIIQDRRNTVCQSDASIVKPSMSSPRKSCGWQHTQAVSCSAKRPSTLIGPSQIKKLKSSERSSVVSDAVFSRGGIPSTDSAFVSRIPAPESISTVVARPHMMQENMPWKKAGTEASNSAPITTDLVPTDALLSKALALNIKLNALRNLTLGRLTLLGDSNPKAWNTSQSFNTRGLASVEDSSMERFYNLSQHDLPTITTVNTSPGILSGGVMTIRSDKSITTTDSTIKSAVMPGDLALDGIAHQARVSAVPGHSVPGTASASSYRSQLIPGADLLPKQKLPPFESINRRFNSRIKKILDEPVPPALIDEIVSNNEPAPRVETFSRGLFSATPDPTSVESLATAGDSSALPDSAASPVVALSVDSANVVDVHNYQQFPSLTTPASFRNQLANAWKAISPEGPPVLSSGIIERKTPKSLTYPQRKPRIPRKRRVEQTIVVCSGECFQVESSILKRASPVLAKIVSMSQKWTRQEQHYRSFEVTGVDDSAMTEILKFICRTSYNHSFMKSSRVKATLDKLEIKYEEKNTYIYLVEPTKRKKKKVDHVRNDANNNAVYSQLPASTRNAKESLF